MRSGGTLSLRAMSARSNLRGKSLRWIEFMAMLRRLQVDTALDNFTMVNEF